MQARQTKPKEGVDLAPLNWFSSSLDGQSNWESLRAATMDDALRFLEWKTTAITVIYLQNGRSLAEPGWSGGTTKKPSIKDICFERIAKGGGGGVRLNGQRHGKRAKFHNPKILQRSFIDGLKRPLSHDGRGEG